MSAKSDTGLLEKTKGNSTVGNRRNYKRVDIREDKKGDCNQKK